MKTRINYSIFSLLLLISVMASKPAYTRDAPITSIPAISKCGNIQIVIPVLVQGFTSIMATSLRIEYDSNALVFVSGVGKAPLGSMGFGAMNVGGGTPLKKLIISWSDITPRTLLPNDTLCFLTFNFLCGNTTLVFNNESAGGTDCEYMDEVPDPMNDMPTSTFYIDGSVSCLGVPQAGPIAGPSAGCSGTTAVYSIPALPNASDYTWSVPAGVTIISGQGTNSITVTLDAAGTGDITVFASSVACGAGATSLPFQVTVNPTPAAPTIAGLVQVCAGTTGVAYSTESGMSGYSWTVSSGGVIVSGQGSNTINVDWNTAGAQTVSITYFNSFGCAPPTPTVINVMVNPLPVVTVSGNNTACKGIIETYTTQPGQTGYIWSVSSGGTIETGAGTYTVEVNFFETGPQFVSVNYTDANGCTAAAPTIFNVMVSTYVPPTITGLSAVCQGTTTFYQTEPGMNTYIWNVSSGGTIQSGGSTNIIEISWNSAGNQTVSVNYTNPGGCSSPLPVTKNVTVNPSPAPTITGPATYCLGSGSSLYSTEPGMSNYSWTVSAGGTITAGAGTNSISVNWTTPGTKSVTINYENAFGCTIATPVAKSVIVGAIPVPTIAGPDVACTSPAGVGYSTETGMTGYDWVTSSGGTIIAGSGTSNITVSWMATGAQWVKVNYITAAGCTAASHTIRNVTVTTVPSPTITGTGTACQGLPGITYTTETGMSDYTWTIIGGTITSGGTTKTATVTWTTTGTQSISVNYTMPGGCRAVNPAIQSVTVNPAPIPTITGLSGICAGTTGLSYSTEQGMTGYTWTISSGGTITAGAGTDMITATWNTAGNQSVSVNYSNSFGCVATPAASKAVVVNPLPSPTITTSGAGCINTSVVYTTENGMTGYTWSVSSGGTITGGTGTNALTVLWNTAGNQWVKVNYINGNGCTALTPKTLNLTVNQLPVPTITGKTSSCAGAAGVTYTTEAGMTGYTWELTGSGTITSGAGTRTITVLWNTVGPKVVSVNYTNTNGCSAATPTLFPLTVVESPTPTLDGPSSVCAGVSGNVYITETGKSNYIWTLSAGGIKTAGGGVSHNSMTVRWTTAGARWVRVNYTNSAGCPAPVPTQFDVAVNALPVPGITGPAVVCVNAPGKVYTTQSGMMNYIWSITGGTITAGSGSNSVTVTWTTAGARWIKVNYTTPAGCTAATPTQYNVTVSPLPVPTITGVAKICVNSSSSYSTQSGMQNYFWTVTGGTIISGQGTKLVKILWNTTGNQAITVTYNNPAGCGPSVPGTKVVTVSPTPTPSITGPESVCVGAVVYYSTEPGMTKYQWFIGGTGGIILSGSTSSTIKVKWVLTGSKFIRVNYTSPAGCSAAMPTIKYVTVTPCTKEAHDTAQAGTITLDDNIILYPNPNDGRWNICKTSQDEENFDILVFNSQGKLIFSEKNISLSASLKQTIDLRPAPSGIYYCILKNELKYITRRFLIQR